RLCSPEIRTRLTIFWAGWLAIAIGGTAIQLQRRKHAERKAGTTLLRLPMNGDGEIPHGLTLFAIGRFFGVVLLLVLGSAMVAIQTSTSAGADWLFQFGVPLVLCATSALHFAPQVLWMREVRLCEAGVLWDQKLLEWDRLIQYRWKEQGEPRLELFNV